MSEARQAVADVAQSSRLQKLDIELQSAYGGSNDQLRQSNAALRTCQFRRKVSATHSLINKSMMAAGLNWTALKAVRAADMAEAGSIIDALEPAA